MQIERYPCSHSPNKVICLNHRQKAEKVSWFHYNFLELIFLNHLKFFSKATPGWNGKIWFFFWSETKIYFERDTVMYIISLVIRSVCVFFLCELSRGGEFIPFNQPIWSANRVYTPPHNNYMANQLNNNTTNWNWFIHCNNNKTFNLVYQLVLHF